MLLNMIGFDLEFVGLLINFAVFGNFSTNDDDDSLDCQRQAVSLVPLADELAFLPHIAMFFEMVLATPS